jgi:Trk-type K+ transport system membrane component
MTVPEWLWTLFLALVFAGALGFTVAHHVLYARRRRSLEFFALLETSGWVVLTLATGVALLGAGSLLLTLTTGSVGLLLVIVGSLLRSPDRA